MERIRMNLAEEFEVVVDVLGGYCRLDESKFVLNQRAHGIFETATARRQRINHLYKQLSIHRYAEMTTTYYLLDHFCCCPRSYMRQFLSPCIDPDVTRPVDKSCACLKWPLREHVRQEKELCGRNHLTVVTMQIAGTRLMSIARNLSMSINNSERYKIRATHW